MNLTTKKIAVLILPVLVVGFACTNQRKDTDSKNHEENYADYDENYNDDNGDYKAKVFPFFINFQVLFA